MADSFFGFDTSLLGSGLDDAIDCPLDEEEVEEDEYDALNDETFGSEAVTGDWERDHEKLSQITESTRQHTLPIHQTNQKNGIEVDIEDSLSHLVLDEKDGIVPRPGVWDSPTNIPVVPKTSSLPVALKNVCTVEELERGLISRPPPGLQKPGTPTSAPNTQVPRTPQFILEYPGINDHLSTVRSSLLNNLASRFPPELGMPGPPPVLLPPHVRLPNVPILPNSCSLSNNQVSNLLRYPLPLPHIMLAHGNQRQALGNFVSNFPQPPRSNLPPPQFMRSEHSLMTPPFNNNHSSHPPLHSQQSHQSQQQQQQQQQQSNNQRNQNRSYHNDQPSNNQPFFKNNQHWNNRNTQKYHHHNHSANGLNDNGEYDEYAGMMSNREKQWLTNIQMLQHNTNQPYFDDYYYTVFSDRQSKKNENQDKQKDKKIHNKNGYREKDKDPSQNVLTKVVYTPMQFENSLGKLQCGSVTAPRKIIDMDVVPNSEPTQNNSLQQKDMKKARQRLLEIERLFTIQLKLEDINNPLAQLAEQQALQQQQSEQDLENKPVKKTAPELINIMLTSILHLLREDKLASTLSIRKGKTLLLRFLPFLSVTEYTSQLGEIWVGIIRGLAVICRRDANFLVRLFPEFYRWLETINDFSTVLRLAKAFLDSANQFNKNSNSLASAVTNKFGVSVIASLLDRAENLYPEDDNLILEWSTFVVTLADIIGTTPPNVAPCQPIAANTLNEHLHRIHGLTIERYAPIESLLTDANLSR